MSSLPASPAASVFPAAPAHARSTFARCCHCNVLPLVRSCPPPAIVTFSSHAHAVFPSRLHGATAGNHHYNQNVAGKSKPLCRGHLGTLESNGCVYSTHYSFALFLGLSHDSGLFLESDSIIDLVVGVLETGVSPEHKSYDGTGFDRPHAGDTEGG
ncbi:hypothetical protein Taro_057001, partial [Colocasia esculenta]|nr:hypothetical protein [Colocasia esculenta]